MKNGFLVIFLLITLSGCTGSQAWYSIRTRETIVEGSKNRQNIAKLKIGMTQDEVIAIMGQPYKTEAYSSGDKGSVFLLYRTEGWNASTWPPQQDTDNQFSPLCFEDNKLVGWGRNFYIEKKKSYEIEIKNR